MATLPSFVAAAEAAELHYLREEALDLRAERSGKRVRYRTADGRPVRDRRVLERIAALVIPPAWAEVRIASDPQGHLQAVGVDAKGRKQYLYHPEWRRLQQLNKFGRMAAFGEVLPEIRARIEADMAGRALTQRRVVATVVWLLDRTFIRIGSREYLRKNGSFGLTTLREKHVEVSGSRICFEFDGKSGKRHQVCVSDPRVATTVRRCIELPGYELFQYLDAEGERRVVASQDVNAYLKEVAGDDFTAKDFRTWGGSVTAGAALYDLGPFETEKAGRKNVTQAVCRVARALGNTAAVCRSYYIHPSLPRAYLGGALVPHYERCYRSYRPRRRGLERAEQAAWTLIRKHPPPPEALEGKGR